MRLINEAMCAKLASINYLLYMYLYQKRIRRKSDIILIPKLQNNLIMIFFFLPLAVLCVGFVVLGLEPRPFI